MKAKTKELFAFVCEQMTKLDKGEIDVEKAKQQANLCKQANNLLKYELDRAKAISKFKGIEIREIEQ